MSPIANMLTQIRNAQSAGHESVSVPFSKIKFKIAEILESRGFVGTVEKKSRKARKSDLNLIQIQIKYDEGKGAIDASRLISKPSRRIYAGKDEIRPVKNGYGISIISTTRGLMTGDEARKAGIGGELLLEVW